jgi:hypothetical protein
MAPSESGLPNGKPPGFDAKKKAGLSASDTGAKS